MGRRNKRAAIGVFLRMAGLSGMAAEYIVEFFDSNGNARVNIRMDNTPTSIDGFASSIGQAGGIDSVVSGLEGSGFTRTDSLRAAYESASQHNYEAAGSQMSDFLSANGMQSFTEFTSADVSLTDLVATMQGMKESQVTAQDLVGLNSMDALATLKVDSPNFV